MDLSKAELTKYSHHIKLKEVGIQGQGLLKESKVLVIGATELGCSVLQQLCDAGIGLLGILDANVVEEHMLQTHLLFTKEDIGTYKAKTAALKLKAQNSKSNFKVALNTLSTENILDVITPFDIIVDCSSDTAMHYLINDACCLQNKPQVFAKIEQHHGQLSVVNYQKGPSYRCLFPEEIKSEARSLNTGILSTFPSLMGSMQANEVLKIVLGIGTVLSGKLFRINILDYETAVVSYEKTAAAHVTKLRSLEPKPKPLPKQLPKQLPAAVSAMQLSGMLQEKLVVHILDVREYFEWDICHIKGAVNIPMNLIDECLEEIPKDTATVVVCHHGVRSENVIHYLKTKGYKNLINLEGGIHAWATTVDAHMPTY